MSTWQGRQIHRTELSVAIRNLWHQGCMLNQQKSAINAIWERMHQTVTNVLRTLVHTNPPLNMTQARDIIDNALATAMHAMQITVATTLGSTPGALAFV
jgi:hypothetical protein